MQLLDETIKGAVTDRLVKLEEHLAGDVAFYLGSIDAGILRNFRDFLEKAAVASTRNCSRLILFLNTPGGSVEIAEKMVEMMRHHFAELYVVVPDAALSAGTILCMAGDRIYMDYPRHLDPSTPKCGMGRSGCRRSATSIRWKLCSVRLLMER